MCIVPAPKDTYPVEQREVTLTAYDSAACRNTFPQFTSDGKDIHYYVDDSVICAANGTDGGGDSCVVLLFFCYAFTISI